jgi:hypothetical protein
MLTEKQHSNKIMSNFTEHTDVTTSLRQEVQSLQVNLKINEFMVHEKLDGLF